MEAAFGAKFHAMEVDFISVGYAPAGGVAIRFQKFGGPTLEASFGFFPKIGSRFRESFQTLEACFGVSPDLGGGFGKMLQRLEAGFGESPEGGGLFSGLGRRPLTHCPPRGQSRLGFNVPGSPNSGRQFRWFSKGWKRVSGGQRGSFLFSGIIIELSCSQE
jgi:hypothetical protein